MIYSPQMQSVFIWLTPKQIDAVKYPDL
ncbi:uncharacterized protein METZ01_LOCUS140870 [marine metagenome]|uniref:Uncharacterized protein n=1 Tax=marine metagenome TaxID=408172 RepID=A0A381ZFG1_9ZZZZ